MESMKLLSFSFEQWADSHDTDPPNQIVICESQEDSAGPGTRWFGARGPGDRFRPRGFGN
jgi:hypothetical protein